MSYHTLSPRLRQYIRQEWYENASEEVRPYLIMMAQDKIARENPTGSTPFDNRYEYSELPPYMNIVRHLFVLRSDADEPSRGQFVGIIRHSVQTLQNMSHYRVRNISVSYNTPEGIVQWFSFARSNIESMGFDQLLDHLTTSEDEWDDDFYGGSDYIRNYFYLRTLNVQRFYIVTDLIQSGMGEVEYSYYKCIEAGMSEDKDCLIDCFRYLSTIDIEPAKVRALLDVEPDIMLTPDYIPKLESMFRIKVCVYEDRRALEFRYKSGKHYDDYQTIIKKDYPVVLYGDLNSPYKILWKDNHCSIIVEEYMARHCHCEHTGVFVGYGNKLTKEEIIKELHRQGRIDTDESTIADDDKTTYYYFFDYETVYDPTTMELIPYAWALVKYDSEYNKIRTWKMIRKYDGEVEIIIGYYWEENREDIFKYYFRSIIQEKYKQDDYKENDENKYNSALRECCKLLMNSLSGKLQQRVFEDAIELVRNNRDLDKFNKRVDNNTETFTPFGNWYIAKGKKINPRPNMPTIWGSLILSYARSYMYDNVLSKINTIYGTDTDSAFIDYEDIPQELIGTKLGQFKKEISIKVDKNESGPYGVFVAPKCYCFYKISEKGEETPIKMRFKGVNTERDKVVYDVKNIMKMNGKELHNTYWNEPRANPNFVGGSRVEEIDISTFRTLLKEDVYILCSSLERKITDKTMSVLKIHQRFLLKKINKTNIEGEVELSRRVAWESLKPSTALRGSHTTVVGLRVYF
ncbi:hypothetical protein BZG36_05719 [Bifiguratus adelaidae]|uniref:DNA-directed DNA polymerase n=1 Tax=Bifiguratus adelaidae TaxID=1938954 RepID=A0A261XTH3_9FUNG|nr:hypothetical protein BZG36_05719 [Bifiguratus adelaidae]